MSDLADLVRRRRGSAWCLFVDRDGVINQRVDGDYVRSWAQLDFVPGALDALAVLTGWAPATVVVTNQQGVGKGLMSDADLDDVHARMLDAIAGAGGTVDAVLVCPHLDAIGCACRKPRAGLALGWLADHPAYDGGASVMVGDSASDLGMARELAAVTGGCAAIGIGAVDGADLTFATLADFATQVSRELQGAPR